MTRLSRRSMLAAGALGALAPRLAGAADYPARTVRVVVPFPAGGTVDPPARVIAEAMSRIAGQSFVIDQRADIRGIELRIAHFQFRHRPAQHSDGLVRDIIL